MDRGAWQAAVHGVTRLKLERFPVPGKKRGLRVGRADPGGTGASMETETT